MSPAQRVFDQPNSTIKMNLAIIRFISPPVLCHSMFHLLSRLELFPFYGVCVFLPAPYRFFSHLITCNCLFSATALCSSSTCLQPQVYALFFHYLEDSVYLSSLDMSNLDQENAAPTADEACVANTTHQTPEATITMPTDNTVPVVA
jgi:hypothetical protein